MAEPISSTIAAAAAAAARVAIKLAAQALAQRAQRGARTWAGQHMSWLVAAGVCCMSFPVLFSAAVVSVVQSSTLAWPVPIPAQGQEDRGWIASGWQVSSGFGWRDDPYAPGQRQFHDGIDLAGPTFCLHCSVPAVFDASVEYIGWDPARDRIKPPDQTGGGIIVRLDNAPPEAQAQDWYELRATYAHLAPYRLHIQLQGRIDDPWDQDAYRPYRDYAEVGSGELVPAPADAAVSIACTVAQPHRTPVFVSRRVGPGTIEIMYDKPVVAPDSCTVAVAWPERGGEWGGWTPDEPTETAIDDSGSVVLRFSTPIDEGKEAGNLALRFRAHLQAPSPPPTPTPSDNATPIPLPTAPAAVAAGGPAPQPMNEIPAVAPSHQARAEHGTARSRAHGVAVANHPGTGAAVGVQTSAANAQHRCGRVTLVRIPARAPDPRMTPDAAAAWERARSSIRLALGYDWLATGQSDILRPPDFRPIRDNQIDESWHKTGRAVDVPQQGEGLRVVTEGAYQRLYVAGVDITRLMVQAGFTRIPSNPGREEWWHFELQGGLSWQGAMAQLYPIEDLKRWFPRRDWSAFACTGDGEPPLPPCADTPREPGGGLQNAMTFIASGSATLTGRFNDVRVINGVPARHGGLDIAAPAGRPIRAWDGGTVVANAYSGIGGYYVIVQSDTGRRTYYGHLQARSPVATGSAIARGTVIGAIGMTGMATGPHVHFQLSDTAGTWIDPEGVLNEEDAGGDVPCDEPIEDVRDTCVEEPPHWNSAVESLSGCGPPITWDTRVRMLDFAVGHVGMTGATSAPHLHLGLAMRNGLSGNYHDTDICTAPWLPPDLAALPASELWSLISAWGVDCWVDAVDPLDFLPRANATAPLPGASSAPRDSEPYQLPPPGMEGALIQPAPADEDSPGEYWSPYPDAGRFGGGGILDWLRSVVCSFLSWLGVPCSPPS